MNVKVKPYKKDSTYSYAIGVYPTLELLQYRSEKVIKILLSTKSDRNEGVKKILQICHAQKIPVEYADHAIRIISESENSYAVGVFEKYHSDIQKDQNHIVMVSPSDSGNLGTITRTMLAFNQKNLVIVRPAVDIFHPRTVRASMGAVFQLNFQYYHDFATYQKDTKNNLYPFMTTGKKDVKDTDLTSPYSLVFGSEGEGLPAEFEKIGTSIKIDQADKVDSLNLAIAVGIALHHTYSK